MLVEKGEYTIHILLDGEMMSVKPFGLWAHPQQLLLSGIKYLEDVVLRLWSSERIADANTGAPEIELNSAHFDSPRGICTRATLDIEARTAATPFTAIATKCGTSASSPVTS